MESGKSEMKGPRQTGADTLPRLQTPPPRYGFTGWRRDGSCPLSREASSMWRLFPQASSTLNALPHAPPPNTITLRVQGGAGAHSLTGPDCRQEGGGHAAAELAFQGGSPLASVCPTGAHGDRRRTRPSPEDMLVDLRGREKHQLVASHTGQTGD